MTKDKTQEEQILEIIKKNLPVQAAGQMKEFIEQAMKDKSALDWMGKQTVELNNQLQEYSKKEEKFKEATKIRLDGEAKLKQAEEKERNLEIETLKIKLEAAEYVKTNFQIFINNLTTNHEFSKSYFGNICVNGNLPNGNYINLNGSVDLTENKI